MSTTEINTSVRTTLDVVPVAGRIGAEVRGVRLSADLDEQTVEAIRAAWLEHKVLFFRNQHHLDEASQEGLTSLFGGAPVRHPTVPAIDGTRYILELDSRHGGRANSWHTDVTFVDAYPKASILRALVVPTAGGDTVWANTAAAYRDLSPELRTLVGQLEELCERRRQLALQQRLHFWLHNWLWLHLPLSVALLVLLAAHVLFALRYG